MIGPLMVYMLVVSVLFSAAALGTEPIFAMRRWPRRFVWASVMVLSITFPVRMAVSTNAQDQRLPAEWLAVPPSEPLDGSSSIPPPRHSYINGQITSRDQPFSKVTSQYSPPHQSWIAADTTLTIGWSGLSVATLIFFITAATRLYLLTRRFRKSEVNGVIVRVTQTLGPAVFGVLRPQILLPEWLLNGAADVRSLAVDHEQQHIAARDPLLLTLSLITVILAPWNPALWWQLNRLRFAIEADCDGRVLRAGADAQEYTEALLTVGQRRAAFPVTIMALTPRTSWLERRVRAFTSEPSLARRLWVGAALLLAVGLVAGAVLVHAPGLAASAELRKLPPRDTMPAAQPAVKIARSRFPDLFSKHFEGTAVIAVVFERDGSLKLATSGL